MSDLHELPELRTITNLDTVRIVADATQLRLIEALDQPRTVKELATAFDMPTTRLYYHINLLEQHGLIQVVESNIVSGIIEKRYQVTARRFDVDSQILCDAGQKTRHIDEIAAGVFDNARRQIRALADAYGEDTNKAAVLALNQGVIALTPEEVAELRAELVAILARYDPDRPKLQDPNVSAQLHHFTFALFPSAEATKFPLNEVATVGGEP